MRTSFTTFALGQPGFFAAAADNAHPSRSITCGGMDGWGHISYSNSNSSSSSRSVKPFRPLTSVKCRGDVTLDILYL